MATVNVRPDGAVSDVVVEILREAGGPLHISDIKQRFLATGRSIPGRGTESNLLSYIVRDPRFTRVSKGTYTLDSSGAGKVRKRRQRRRKAKRGSTDA